MPTRSKYATLDRVIIHALRQRPEHGMSQCTVVNWGSVRAFARPFVRPGVNISQVVSRRLRSLYERGYDSPHGAGCVTNNGVSGDGCRWFAAP